MVEIINKNKVIRDKAFAKRLDTAMHGLAQAPEGHGRQKWLRDRLAAQFSAPVTTEGVRKWFAGEARPRPSMMKTLAAALEVDEAWLSLGLLPDQKTGPRKEANAIASGAVNLVAALAQLAGGVIAFPEDKNGTTDVFVILRGRQYQIKVVMAGGFEASSISMSIPSEAMKSVVIGVVPTDNPLVYDLIRLPEDLVAEHGQNRGGYIELSVDHQGSAYTIGTDALPIIKSFDNLDGEVPRKRGVSAQAKRALDL